ncbi:hypothetical protein [Motiliproteus sp. SC1-56]|uniref:hypothetical protein n=1 Tax=Motiliproteus sp. SC1-56 TaxID=2799565 RepID=UPI001A8E41D3|nr:hypothetical protein [Motiliproteus sp. SC1-56]
MKRQICCFILTTALAAQAASGTTVYRCDIQGVATFQDTPCANTPAPGAQSAPGDPRLQVLQQRRSRLLELRRELRQQLLNLELAARQVAPSAGASQATTSADYAQRAQRQRQHLDYQYQLQQQRQRLGQVEDNLRILDERIKDLAGP